MTERRSILDLTREEIESGEWQNDPVLVAEFERLNKITVAAIERTVAEMSDEDRESLIERLKHGTYSYGQDLIRVEGEM